jgi:Asp-tRNA(Asn)/Glu-tRNA(Gln) amidotransferase A subunit family amidase
MTLPRRAERGRRAFLQQVPGLVAAGALAPALVDAQTPAAPPAGVGSTQTGAATPTPLTAADLTAAQRIAGVTLPEAELTRALPLVSRARGHIERVRRVELDAGVEPAFSFRPSGGRPIAGTAAFTMPNIAALTRAVVAAPQIDALAFAPLTTLAAHLRARHVTSTDLTAMYLRRLRQYDPVLHCVVTLTDELAMAQAARADRDIGEGRYRGPLHGIPYGIKDLFATRGIRTTWGAAPYATHIPTEDATVVSRLAAAGAVLVAKLSTGELAIGDLWFGGQTRNPWNPQRGSGGSSAGPASAVAAGLVGFAIGTETGGSIIGPSATCGATGLRPTYGRVPRTGCMTLRWTMDKVGPITRSTDDAGLVLQWLVGPDERDETVAPGPWVWSGSRDLRGLRIGVVRSDFDTPPEDASADSRARWERTRPAFTAALDVYRAAGASLVPVTLPTLPAASIYALLNAEAGAMFDELLRSGRINMLADTGENGRANQLRGTRFIPAVDYIRAQRVRTLLLRDMNALLGNVDVFLAPSSSDSVTMTNLTGHPSAVVPAGLVDGLPIGLMVTGGLWQEDVVLRVASAFQDVTDWHTRTPPLA